MNVKNIITCASMAAAIGMCTTSFASGGSSGRITAADTKDAKWSENPVVNESGFKIQTTGKQWSPVVVSPVEKRTKDIQVTEFAVRFDNPTFVSDLPDIEQGAICVVKDAHGQCRFACYADHAWTTNTEVVAKTDVDYTVEVTVDNPKKQIAYRVKSGGNPFEKLYTGKFNRKSSGEVTFSGNGNVKEIRWEDRDAK